MDKPYQLRFRHLAGDVGPLPFQESSNVAAMKAAIWEHWPESGELSTQVRFGSDILTRDDLMADPMGSALCYGRPVTWHLLLNSVVCIMASQ